MKPLLFFFTLFLVLSSSISMSVAEGVPLASPPEISSQELTIVLSYNITPPNYISLWSWDKTVVASSFTGNVTPGVIDSGGNTILQFAAPVHYGFSYQYALYPGFTGDYAPEANLTGPNGSLIESWGYPPPGNLMGYFGNGLLNFNYGQSLYNDTLTLSIVNLTSTPHEWYPAMVIHFVEQTRTVIQTQVIYHNSTVSKPYIPWIVYVIIGVLMASTIGFGIQGHEDEEKLRRNTR